MLDSHRFPVAKYLPKPAFDNAEYRVHITHTVATDKRIMSFVDVLWGFEVTGGYDQWEPLTVIHVMRSGYAFRAGLRVNDRIVRINHTFAGTLTLREAQILIRRSGKRLKIYVQGNDDPYTEDEFTVDFWFKPPRRVLEVEDVWNDCFPWNDRKKFRYRESNCFRVPSKGATMLETRGPRIIEPSLDNSVEEAIPPPPSRSPSRSRTPCIPIEDEHNFVLRRPQTPTDRSVSPNRTVHKYLLL